MDLEARIKQLELKNRKLDKNRLDHELEVLRLDDRGHLRDTAESKAIKRNKYISVNHSYDFGGGKLSTPTDKDIQKKEF